MMGMDRRLTVTYYTEPQNLRHVSLPLRGVRATLVVVGICCAWTIGSMVYLGVAGVQHLADDDATAAPTTATTAEIQAVTAAHAAETASSATGSAAIDAKPVTEEQAAQDALDSLAQLSARLEALRTETRRVGVAADAATSAAAGAVSGGKTGAQNPAPVVASAPPAPTGPLVVNDPIFKAEGKQLAASFAIQNSGAHGAEGAVWGAATFQADDGQIVVVASHAGIDVERLDHPGNHQLGTPYKAKRLTRKDLKFETPDGLTGKFKDVKILISDDVRRKVLLTGFGLPE